MQPTETPYGWLDTGATSNFVTAADAEHCKKLGYKSLKRVKLANGQEVPAGEQLILKNGLRHPANTADSIPSLSTSLISNSKLADAGYVTVFNEAEVNVYDSRTTQVHATAKPVLTGQRDEATGLWRIPIAPNNQTSRTPTSSSLSNTEDIVANVHELYLHASAGFPTKSTWLSAIKKGFYATWPMLTQRTAAKGTYATKAVWRPKDK